MKRLCLAALVVGAFCALGGGVAAPASADICAISTETVGNYGARAPDNASGSCNTPGTVGTKKYILVKNRGNRLAGSSVVACAEVTETQKGNFANSDCSTPVTAGTGAFVKIKVTTNFFGRWSVESQDAKELSAGVEITKLTSAKATLKSKIAGTEVKFTTSTAPELSGIKLEGEDKLTTGGTVNFKGVTTELNGKASAACTPLGEKGKEASLGTITSKKTKGGLRSYEESAATQVLPETGNVFATLFFGKECSLPEEVSVITKKETGEGLVLTDPLGIGKELTEHEITELAALTELWLISETAEHKATIEGEAAVDLSGSHNGLEWSGTPDELEVS
jgi:hypothetical protein